MRGSPVDVRKAKDGGGIIPAHAGLTLCLYYTTCALRDHPRACGAHCEGCDGTHCKQGSSPRMRGSPCFYRRAVCRRGIIPAHAGLTPRDSMPRPLRRDHPRACGAHPCALPVYIPTPGSSPRMRGSPYRLSENNSLHGIIPAHAGLTYPFTSVAIPFRDHPRACGAH